MDSIAPSGHEVATRQDIDGILAAMDAMDERWEERLTSMDERWEERLTAMDRRWDERITGLEQRWEERITGLEQRSDERFGAVGERFGSMDERLGIMDERWQAEGKALRAELVGAIDRRVGDAITTQTRIMMVSLFVALVAIAGLAFGMN